MTMTIADLRVAGADDGRVGSRADRPRRRSFTAEFKRRILAEYDRASEPGAKGALLRRENLYHSHIIEWRRARDTGELAALSPQPRAPRRTAEQEEIERLQARNERLENELKKTKAALDIVGKASAFLDLLSERADSEPPSTK